MIDNAQDRGKLERIEALAGLTRSTPARKIISTRIDSRPITDALVEAGV